MSYRSLLPQLQTLKLPKRRVSATERLSTKTSNTTIAAPRAATLCRAVSSVWIVGVRIKQLLAINLVVGDGLLAYGDTSQSMKS